MPLGWRKYYRYLEPFHLVQISSFFNDYAERLSSTQSIYTIYRIVYPGVETIDILLSLQTMISFPIVIIECLTSAKNTKV